MSVTFDKLAELPVTKLAGIGAEQAEALEKAFGIETVLDLVMHYPRRHLDLTKMTTIRDAHIGDETWIFGRVVSSHVVRGHAKVKARLELRIKDDTGFMKMTFFNQPWRQKQFPDGIEAMFFGKVSAYKGAKSMSPKEVDLLGEPELGIRPIYPQSDKRRLYSRDLRKWITNALDRAEDFVDPVPPEVLDRFDFVDRTAAFNGYHRPQNELEIAEARRRLVFDELLRIQLALVLRKRSLERRSAGIAHSAGRTLSATANSTPAVTPLPSSTSTFNTSGIMAARSPRAGRPGPGHPCRGTGSARRSPLRHSPPRFPARDRRR